MGGAAENLNGQSWLNPAGAFFQKSNELFFGFANAPECGAEADANSILRLFARIFQPCIIECEFGGRDGKLRVTIEPFETMRRKKFFRIPIANFTPAAHMERIDVKAGNPADAALLGKDRFPEVLPPMPDAGDWADAGDDRAPSAHAATWFPLVSTYAFIQRNVLLAMLRMKKSPMILSATGANKFTRNFRSCMIST